MSRNLDEHQLWQDERAADLRDRDRSREPARLFPRVRPGTDTRSIRLDCPECSGPVYATADSDRERLSCTSCQAKVSTRRNPDGSVRIVLIEVESAEDLTFAGIDEQLTRVGEMIKLDQIKNRGRR